MPITRIFEGVCQKALDQKSLRGAKKSTGCGTDFTDFITTPGGGRDPQISQISQILLPHQAAVLQGFCAEVNKQAHVIARYSV